VDDRSEDHLFEPTLGAPRARSDSGPRPWRLDSQGYVSFFGGPLAAALVGVLNGRRLGLQTPRLVWIAATGLVAFAVAAAVIAGTGSEVPRLVLIVAGVLTYVVSRRLQKPADERWRVGRSDDEAYASLWAPGLAIVVGAALATGVALVMITS
jgi:hypothetical protein